MSWNLKKKNMGLSLDKVYGKILICVQSWCQQWLNEETLIPVILF